MADSTRLLSETIVVTLTVTEDVVGTSTNVAADATPTAEVWLHAQVVDTITASEVSNPSTGVYTFSFSPSYEGIHVVVWAWVYGCEDYTSEFKIKVIADPAGTVTDDGDEAAAVVPDIGSDSICTVTAQFYDAEGNGLEGVYVRFTPLRAVDSFLSAGVLVQEATSSSDEDGAFSMGLVKNVKGTLAVTGLGIVRQVTIPDVATTTLSSLIALGDDLLTVQTPDFTSLPRRS